MKKIYALFVIAIYVFASLGGSWVCFSHNEPQFGASVLILAAMAFPYAKDNWDELTD